MSEPYIGEIRMFAGNFAPRGWAFCDGQLLAISANDALFSLLGTIYGGDGRTTFGLPDMRGRIPLHQGTGPGLSSRTLGSRGGEENVTLTTNQIPSHTHDARASSAAGTTADPTGQLQAGNASVRAFRSTSSTNASFAAASVGDSGGSQRHTNLMPAICVNFIIALVGIYPSRQ